MEDAGEYEVVDLREACFDLRRSEWRGDYAILGSVKSNRW